MLSTYSMQLSNNDITEDKAQKVHAAIAVKLNIRKEIHSEYGHPGSHGRLSRCEVDSPSLSYILNPHHLHENKYTRFFDLQVMTLSVGFSVWGGKAV